MKKIFSLITFIVFASFVSCEEYDPGVEAPSSLSFEFASRTVAFTDDTNTYEVNVFSTQKSNVDRTVQIIVMEGLDADQQPYTTAEEGDFTISTTSVVIPAGEYGGSFEITLNPELPLTASRYVTFGIVTPENYALNTTKDKIKINYNRQCFSNTIVFNLTLDPWGTETTWEIKDSSDLIVQQGGPYMDGNGLQPQPEMSFTLEDGDYTFTIYDVYGDGLSGSTTSGPGSYLIAKDCGSLLIQGGGDFGATASHTFSLP